MCRICAAFQHGPPDRTAQRAYQEHLLHPYDECPLQYIARMVELARAMIEDAGPREARRRMVGLRREWARGVREGTHPAAFRKMQLTNVAINQAGLGPRRRA